MNSWQNSVKGPKNPESAKKCHNVPKNATKKPNIATILIFLKNSVKGTKDLESAKKVTCDSTMCQKMSLKSAKSRHDSLSWQNSVKSYTDFTQARKKFTQTLFAWLYVFASLFYTTCTLEKYLFRFNNFITSRQIILGQQLV